jgi:hypothetical protein
VPEHIQKIMDDYSEMSNEKQREVQAKKMERFFELLVHRLLVDITDEQQDWRLVEVQQNIVKA